MANREYLLAGGNATHREFDQSNDISSSCHDSWSQEVQGTRNFLGATRIAVIPIRMMNGGSQSCLVRDSSHNLWVLKLRYNHQHDRVVLNEFLGTSLARGIGLTVPAAAFIRISDTPIWRDMLNPERTALNLEETHFATAFVGSSMPGRVYEIAPRADSFKMMNQDELAGVLALDIWLGNEDRRQAIFVRHRRSNLFRAHWIDFGSCFGGPTWCTSNQLGRLSCVPSTYPSITSMEDFEPWVRKIEDLSLVYISRLWKSVPASWQERNEPALAALMGEILYRRTYLRRILMMFALSNPNIFPHWSPG